MPMPMTSWNDFEPKAPDLAAFAQARIEAHGLALLATLRADGAPDQRPRAPHHRRPAVDGHDARLAQGRRPPARPALRPPQRDGRQGVTDGDVKIAGRAVDVADAAPRWRRSAPPSPPRPATRRRPAR